MLAGVRSVPAVAFLRDTLAPQFGVEIDDVSAVASASSDLRGLLAMDDAAPDLGDLALDIRVVTASPGDRTAEMLAAWQDRCPIYIALLKPNSINLSTAVATS